MALAHISWQKQSPGPTIRDSQSMISSSQINIPIFQYFLILTTLLKSIKSFAGHPVGLHLYLVALFGVSEHWRNNTNYVYNWQTMCNVLQWVCESIFYHGVITKVWASLGALGHSPTGSNTAPTVILPRPIKTHGIKKRRSVPQNNICAVIAFHNKKFLI